MARVRLEKIAVYNNTVYGPGEITVPRHVAKHFLDNGTATVVTRGGAAAPTAPEGSDAGTPTGTDDGQAEGTETTDGTEGAVVTGEPAAVVTGEGHGEDADPADGETETAGATVAIGEGGVALTGTEGGPTEGGIDGARAAETDPTGEPLPADFPAFGKLGVTTWEGLMAMRDLPGELTKRERSAVEAEIAMRTGVK